MWWVRTTLWVGIPLFIRNDRGHIGHFQLSKNDPNRSRETQHIALHLVCGESLCLSGHAVRHR